MHTLSYPYRLIKNNNAKAGRLRESLFLHSVVVFLLLLPLGLGLAGSIYLRGIALIGLLYFFFRSVVDVKWSVTIYLLFFFLLPDTWAFDFGSFLPLITLRRMLLLILLLSFVLNYRKFRRRDRFHKPFRFAIGLLIFSYAMSTILSIDFRTSFFSLLHLIVEQILLMFIIYRVLHDRELAKNGLKALCLAALILCIFGNIEYISNFNYFTQVSLSESALRVYWDTYEGIQRLGISGRIHSLCIHPMTFGGFLAIIFPVAIAFTLLSSNLLNRLLFLIIAFLCVGGVFLSLARSPVMALFGGLVVMLILLIKEWWIKKSAFILFISIVFLIGIFSLYEPTRNLFHYSVKFWAQPEEMGGSSLSRRIEQYEGALFYATRKPLFGYGLGAARVGTSGIFNPKLVGYAESIWISRLLDSGVIGILSLVLFLSMVIVMYYRIYKLSKGSPENILAASGISSFVALIVFNTATGEMGTFGLIFVLLPLMIRSTLKGQHKAIIKGK